MQATPPAEVNFNLANAYYVFNLATRPIALFVAENDIPTSPRVRPRDCQWQFDHPLGNSVPARDRWWPGSRKCLYCPNIFCEETYGVVTIKSYKREPEEAVRRMSASASKRPRDGAAFQSCSFPSDRVEPRGGPHQGLQTAPKLEFSSLHQAGEFEPSRSLAVFGASVSFAPSRQDSLLNPRRPDRNSLALAAA